MKELNQLKKEYQAIEIPDELEFMMKKTIIRKEKQMKRNRRIKASFASVAAILILFIGTINLFPSAAYAMYQIPVLKNLVQLVTFRELTYQDDHYEADIKVPKIEGLENTDLANSLNEKYLEENTKLYNDFLAEIGEEELTPQKLALFTNFTVKTNTEDLYVIERIKTAIAASGSESVHYDNIDLKNQIIITLPSLFTDDRYIDRITDNIKVQMTEQMNTDENMMYFIDGDGSVGGFTKIDPEQSFYITADSNLVIVFDEYAVAPGSMGIVEFTIPTEVIKDLLVSNTYIK